MSNYLAFRNPGLKKDKPLSEVCSIVLYLLSVIKGYQRTVVIENANVGVIEANNF